VSGKIMDPLSYFHHLQLTTKQSYGKVVKMFIVLNLLWR